MAVPHGTSAGTLNGGASACIGDPMVPSFDVPGALPFETIFPILGFVSSDRSSCSDDGLVYIHPLFEIFTQSLDAIDVTSVTLSRLNSINAIDVT